MQANPWKTPFGLAFIALTLLAFVVGLLSGGGNEAVDNVSLNEGADSYSVDENALINANIEPEPVYEPAPPPRPVPEPVEADPPADPPADDDGDSNLVADTDPPE